MLRLGAVVGAAPVQTPNNDIYVLGYAPRVAIDNVNLHIVTSTYHGSSNNHLIIKLSREVFRRIAFVKWALKGGSGEHINLT